MLKRNYFSFKGKAARMQDEKARIEELIRELQISYLEAGKIETHLYNNRMKSYIARLSEIEEKMAMEEANKEMSKNRGLFGFIGRKPPNAM